MISADFLFCAKIEAEATQAKNASNNFFIQRFPAVAAKELLLAELSARIFFLSFLFQKRNPFNIS